MPARGSRQLSCAQAPALRMSGACRLGSGCGVNSSRLVCCLLAMGSKRIRNKPRPARLPCDAQVQAALCTGFAVQVISPITLDFDS